MVANPHSIGEQVNVVAAINPVDQAAGTVNGAAIDRYGVTGNAGYMSCVLHLACGAASGAPSAQTVDAVLQDSATGTDGWTDLTGASVTQLTADNTSSQVNINLAGARRYVRAEVTVGFTAGTSPAIDIASTVVLGGSTTRPV